MGSPCYYFIRYLPPDIRKLILRSYLNKADRILLRSALYNRTLTKAEQVIVCLECVKHRGYANLYRIIKDSKLIELWEINFIENMMIKQHIPAAPWFLGQFANEFVRKYYWKACYDTPHHQWKPFFDSIRPLHNVAFIVTVAYGLSDTNPSRYLLLEYLRDRDDVDKKYLYKLCEEMESLSPKWQEFTDKLYHDYVWRSEKKIKTLY